MRLAPTGLRGQIKRAGAIIDRQIPAQLRCRVRVRTASTSPWERRRQPSSRAAACLRPTRLKIRDQPRKDRHELLDRHGDTPLPVLLSVRLAAVRLMQYGEVDVSVIAEASFRHRRRERRCSNDELICGR